MQLLSFSLSLSQVIIDPTPPPPPPLDTHSKFLIFLFFFVGSRPFYYVAFFATPIRRCVSLLFIISHPIKSSPIRSAAGGADRRRLGDVDSASLSRSIVVFFRLTVDGVRDPTPVSICLLLLLLFNALCLRHRLRFCCYRRCVLLLLLLSASIEHMQERMKEEEEDRRECNSRSYRFVFIGCLMGATSAAAERDSAYNRGGRRHLCIHSSEERRGSSPYGH